MISSMNKFSEIDFTREENMVIMVNWHGYRMLVSAAFGEIRYCLFVSTPGIKIMSESERKRLCIFSSFTQ